MEMGTNMEMNMVKLVTIFGGSGFVGRYVARRMAKQGWRVRVATRRPNEAMFVKPYGTVGQVAPVFCNIRDDASVAAALDGADAVVNCVGILNEFGANTFGAVQTDGAERVARLAAAAGVSRLVHVSALGADADSESEYAQSKAEGEAAVLANFKTAMILRPSVLFGAEDGFFNKFAAMAGWGPFLMLVGGTTKMQPTFVDDVAAAVEMGVLGTAKPGLYELGGPDVETLRELIDRMLATIERRRVVINLPFWAGSLIGGGLDIAQYVSMGLFQNTLLSKDQVTLLRTDNVVSPKAKGFDALGIKPTAMEAVLPDYLWCYRPSGQYAEIKESARNLKA